MPVTIEQIKEQITSGKVTTIYYSANTLWWTHDEKDLEEATAIGKATALKRREELMKRQDIPEEERQRIGRLFAMANSTDSIMPMDPTGSVLMMTDNPMKWITAAENKPEHFGKYGLGAFMFSHHQNCSMVVFTKWDAYNLFIDLQKSDK